MSVYFVYRSHYDNPGAFHVKVFPQDTVLAWFRSIWVGIPMPSDRMPDDAQRHVEALIGRDIHNLELLFTSIQGHGWRPPKSMTAAAQYVREAMYTNEMRFGPHHMQWLLDDGEFDSATYVFDDHYAEKNPHRAVFLMRPDWRLPDSAAEGDFKPKGVPKTATLVGGVGVTYFAAFDSYNLLDMSEYKASFGKVVGVRVADLPRYLFAIRNRIAENPDDGAIHAELRQLAKGLDTVIVKAKGDEKAFLAALSANPDDYAGWCAYCDWRMEHDRPPLLAEVMRGYKAQSGAMAIQASRNPLADDILIQTHIAQASKHFARWGADDWDLFRHVILFDDEWANAHPDLAASILRTASRWDPL